MESQTEKKWDKLGRLQVFLTILRTLPSSCVLNSFHCLITLFCVSNY